MPLVRQMGRKDASLWSGGKVALTTSTGGSIVVILDPNRSESPVGWGDRTNVPKIYVYEANDNARSAYTLRATFNATGLTDVLGRQHVEAELYSDNSIAIAWFDSANNARFAKVTTGTWAVTQSTAIATVTDSIITDITVTVTDSNKAVVSALYTRTLGGSPGTFFKSAANTTGTTWLVSPELGFTPNLIPINQGTATIDSAFSVGSGTATARNVFVSYAYRTQHYVDTGVKTYQLLWNDTANTWGVVALVRTEGAGELRANATFTAIQEARHISLYSLNDGKIVIASSVWEGGLIGGFSIINPDGSQFMARQRIVTSTPGVANVTGMAITFGVDSLNFVFIAKSSLSKNAYDVVNYAASFNTTTKTARVSNTQNLWDNAAGVPTWLLGGGGQFSRNFRTHDIMFMRKSAAHKYNMYVVTARPAPTNQHVAPANGSTTGMPDPALQSRMSAGIQFPQGLYKGGWRFSRDAAGLTDTRYFYQPDSKFARVQNTHNPGTYYNVNEKLPLAAGLPSGTWWVLPIAVSDLGITTPLTTPATSSFTVSHPPRADYVSPVGRQPVVWGTGSVTVSWAFSDTFSLDSQSAYQVYVHDTETETTVYDSGKVMSSAQSAQVTIPSGSKGHLLQWEVIVWDLGDAQSQWHFDWEEFYALDSGTITALAPSGVIASGNPTVTFNYAPGSMLQAARTARVTISKGADYVYAAEVSVADQTSMSIPIPTGYLRNATAYTLTVAVTDSFGLTRTQSSTFQTQWTPPAGVSTLTVNTTPYNTENQGYVELSWTNAAQDADFVRWDVMRKTDQIDPHTLAVITPGVWERIGWDVSTLTAHTFRDYYAASASATSYRIVQVVNRFGDEVFSEAGTDVVVYPNSDGYWLIDPTPEDQSASAFKLGHVTDDQFTEEYESETYNVIGRGRHYEQGDNLGVTGTLTVKFRDGSTSARAKHTRLRKLKEEARGMFMRNPFGDVFWVATGDIGYTREAGVGKSEHVDVTIPYQEVSDE